MLICLYWHFIYASPHWFPLFHYLLKYQSTKSTFPFAYLMKHAYTHPYAFSQCLLNGWCASCQFHIMCDPTRDCHLCDESHFPCMSQLCLWRAGQRREWQLSLIWLVSSSEIAFQLTYLCHGSIFIEMLLSFSREPNTLVGQLVSQLCMQVQT